MAIVISYPVGTTTLSTMLLGSQYDSETGVAITKNFSVGSISNLILSLIPPGVDSVFGRIGDVLAVSGDYTTSLVTEGSNLYYTDVRAREAITLTTIGASGAATYNNVSGVLNIPQYSGGSGIAWLESNATDLTVWNNGKGNIETNTSFGIYALSSNITGVQNTALGQSALYNNTEGGGNIAIGGGTLLYNTIGSGNTAIGLSSLSLNTTGSSHTAVGFFALAKVSTSSGNTAVGDGAGNEVTTGAYNTMVGYRAGGTALTSSAANIYIGANSGPAADTIESNKLYISNTLGTPLIGGDFANKIVTINQVLVLTPVTSLPTSPVDGMITVQGIGAAQHIYCYINGAWKQLDN